MYRMSTQQINQAFERDLRREIELHDGEGRIYSAHTIEMEGESVKRFLYLAVGMDEKCNPIPYWTSEQKSQFKTWNLLFLGELARNILQLTDYEGVYVKDQEYGFMTYYENPRLNKKKGDQQ